MLPLKIRGKVLFNARDIFEAITSSSLGLLVWYTRFYMEKEMKLIIRYFEDLKAKGEELGPVEEETLARAYRIIGVAAFSSLGAKERFDPTATDEFSPEEVLAAMRKASFWG